MLVGEAAPSGTVGGKVLATRAGQFFASAEVLPRVSCLDKGETAAIALAESLHADLLLMDECVGCRVARSRALRVTGTLGILDLAAEHGLLISVRRSKNSRTLTSIGRKPCSDLSWKSMAMTAVPESSPTFPARQRTRDLTTGRRTRPTHWNPRPLVACCSRHERGLNLGPIPRRQADQVLPFNRNALH